MLILNAGALNPTQKMTQNGLEPHFGINHLAHFHLTNLLLPVLRTTPDSRVVVVSSEGHRQGVVSLQ